MLRLAPAGPKAARLRGAAIVAALGGAMVAVPTAAQDATYRDHPFLIFDEEDSRTADVALADLDGDGDLDVAAANGRHWPQQDWIFFNEGGGRLLEAAPLGARRAASYTIRLGDLDSDGDIDAVVVRDLLPAQVFLNAGSGAFSHAGDIPDSAAPARSGTLADLNGDGMLDLVIATRRKPDRIHFGMCGGSFGGPVALPDKGYGSTGIVADDIDGDGDTDLIFARRDGVSSVIFVNRGKGDFTPVPLEGSEGDHRKPAVADFDGDGRKDVVLVSTGGEHVVYRQTDAVSFERAATFGQSGERIQAITAGDLDGDGDVDLVAGVDGENLVYRNDGSGRFVRETLPGLSADTYGVALGDMNGDGRLDVVFANSDAPNQVLLGLDTEQD